MVPTHFSPRTSARRQRKKRIPKKKMVHTLRGNPPRFDSLPRQAILEMTLQALARTSALTTQLAAFHLMLHLGSVFGKRQSQVQLAQKEKQKTP
jgi:hypothetical protein